MECVYVCVRQVIYSTAVRFCAGTLISESVDVIVQLTQRLRNSMETLAFGMKFRPSITIRSVFIAAVCWHARCGTEDKLSSLRIPLNASGHLTVK